MSKGEKLLTVVITSILVSRFASCWAHWHLGARSFFIWGWSLLSCARMMFSSIPVPYALDARSNWNEPDLPNIPWTFGRQTSLFWEPLIYRKNSCLSQLGKSDYYVKNHWVFITVTLVDRYSWMLPVWCLHLEDEKVDSWVEGVSIGTPFIVVIKLAPFPVWYNISLYLIYFWGFRVSWLWVTWPNFFGFHLTAMPPTLLKQNNYRCLMNPQI